MSWVFQGEKECLNSETTELKQKIRYLQDQLLPLSKQREYQEKEIQRLNRVSEKEMEIRSNQEWRHFFKLLLLHFIIPNISFCLSYIRLLRRP